VGKNEFGGFKEEPDTRARLKMDEMSNEEVYLLERVWIQNTSRQSERTSDETSDDCLYKGDAILQLIK